MTQDGTQPATQRPERPATNGPISGHLSREQESSPVTTAEPPPDPLIALYQRAAEEDLKARRRFEQRLASAERRKQVKAGHAGALSVALELPRRHWPAVHEAATRHHIPIRTQRLPRGVTNPIRVLTTEGGALRLRASVPELAPAPKAPPAWPWENRS